MDTASLVGGMTKTMRTGAHSGMNARMTGGEALSIRRLQHRRLVVRLLVVAADQIATIVGHPHDLARVTGDALPFRNIGGRVGGSHRVHWRLVLGVRTDFEVVAALSGAVHLVRCGAVHLVPLLNMVVVHRAHFARGGRLVMMFRCHFVTCLSFLAESYRNRLSPRFYLGPVLGTTVKVASTIFFHRFFDTDHFSPPES